MDQGDSKLYLRTSSDNNNNNNNNLHPDTADLSNIRNIASNTDKDDASSETDLENLAELVPNIKQRRGRAESQEQQFNNNSGGLEDEAMPRKNTSMQQHQDSGHLDDSGNGAGDRTARTDDCYEIKEIKNDRSFPESPRAARTKEFKIVGKQAPPSPLRAIASVPTDQFQGMNPEPGMSSSDSDKEQSYGDLDDYPDSDHVADGEGIEVQDQEEADVPPEFMNMSSGQSISTATQTHEVRMPMYLPTFKPATGCTNASDFIVRCFVARLRSGITVVKHGRSRWCKSRLRILHIHADGRSLSWRPAEGEPPTSKRPPKLDLSTCLEVRHAWSPDPQNPMYTGTPILRQKCEAANAHKSFALIFKTRTVDVTAVTADQCKVLMEGFSALCFRLQVANLAGRTNNNKKGGQQQARPMPEEDGVSTTASATLTNRSTPKAGP